MTNPRDPDANLLFGVLAFQNGFITRDQLVAGMQAWVENKQLPLHEHLLKAGALSTQVQQHLQPLVALHIHQHNDDPQRSLASISSAAEVQQDLAGIIDSELQHSLLQVRQAAPRARAGGMNARADVTLTLGDSSSKGTRFHILRPHARGGLGEVFVARDTELGREVALKEIQLDKSHDADARSRFTREAEITGGLEHPGIVPVYGLGAYPDGRPFYAMRFIRGESLQEAIKAYHGEGVRGEGQGAREESGGRDSPPSPLTPRPSPLTPRPSPLSTEKNLELRRLLQRFIDVCEAIDYAHSRGVLHRDLKPGNIMLGKYGETLVVDWGLAKAAGGSLDSAHIVPRGDETKLNPRSGESSDTIAGAALGTPAYMPPEQADGRLDLLGPSSDVYSLGATLYCVLTGQPPIQASSAHEALEKVRRGEILQPRQLNHRIPPQLEAICMKAMSLRPNERYASARELADEVEHWLADEPVAAYLESWVQQIRRQMRKRPVLSGSLFTSLVVGFLAVGVGSFLLAKKNRELGNINRDLTIARDEAVAQTKEANTQRRLADEQAARADQNAALAQAERDRVAKAMSFLATAFRKADPAEDGGELKAAELLLLAGRQAHASLSDEPLLHAEVLSVIWQTLVGLDRAQEAFSLAEHAARLRTEQLGADHPATLTSLNNLAVAHRLIGQNERSVKLHTDVLQKQRELMPADQRAVLLSMSNLASAHHAAGHFEKAVTLFSEALAGQVANLPANDPDTLVSMGNLASAYQSSGNTERALALHAETFQRTSTALGINHPRTLVALHNLALAYEAAGMPEQALPHLEKAWQAQRGKLGPNHRHTLLSTNHLAHAFESARQFDKALPLYVEALAGARKTFGPDHPNTLKSLVNLASVQLELGDVENAVPLWEEYIEAIRRTSPADSLALADGLSMSAHYLAECKAWIPAQFALQEAHGIQSKLQPDDWTTFRTLAMLGGAMAGQAVELSEEDATAAEPLRRLAEGLLKGGVEGLFARHEQIPPTEKIWITKATQQLIDLYDACGKTAEAKEWKERLNSGALKAP